MLCGLTCTLEGRHNSQRLNIACQFQTDITIVIEFSVQLFIIYCSEAEFLDLIHWLCIPK